MPMNKGLQAHIIEKKFEKQGVHDIDLKSLIDNSLSLPENVENLKEKGYLKEKKDKYNAADVRRRQVQAQVKQAVDALEDKHEYTQHQAATDTGKTAETTFQPPLTEEEFHAWVQNPDEYDIEGVDTEDDLLNMKLEF
jgi:hypothetical protein